jgi:hypothetical protein|tara:strand:- start:343 stop:834 length:492 start_codon:yes stop_codon:yes gene_type:complete
MTSSRIKNLRQSFELGNLPDKAVLEFEKEINNRMNIKSEQQIINELKRKYRAFSTSGSDFDRSRNVPEAMLKWQEILKKKPFKGYNKKIHARTGGLSAKGRAKFKREQGSNLKAPVTTKPSKLKRGSKAWKRRKNFCSRSRGFKRDDGTYSEKAKAARRRWNC